MFKYRTIEVSGQAIEHFGTKVTFKSIILYIFSLKAHMHVSVALQREAVSLQYFLGGKTFVVKLELMFIYFLFFLLHTKTFLIHDSLRLLHRRNKKRSKKNLVDAPQYEQHHKNGVMSRIVCCTLLLNNDNNNKNEELEHLYTI